MSEWYDNQRKPNSNFRKLLQERFEKANPRHNLTAEETKRLARLEAIANKLRRRENVQNRQLQTWLSEDDYAQIEAEWQEQIELREELKDKPSDLKRYEEKLKQATFNYNRAEGYSSKGKYSTAKNFYNKSESLCEDALEIPQEIMHSDSTLRVWFDRQMIAYHLEQEAEEYFAGEIELDGFYFGGVRKGKRGRGAAGKVIVFGLLKRGGKVYAKIVEDTKTSTLMPIIERTITLDSIVYTDCYRSYNALDVSGFHHYRINHSTHFANGKHNHINGIENFWNQAKRVLRKYNGTPKNSFPLFIKECEFRFNYGTPKQQLKQLKSWCQS